MRLPVKLNPSALPLVFGLFYFFRLSTRMRSYSAPLGPFLHTKQTGSLAIEKLRGARELGVRDLEWILFVYFVVSGGTCRCNLPLVGTCSCSCAACAYLGGLIGADYD